MTWNPKKGLHDRPLYRDKKRPHLPGIRDGYALIAELYSKGELTLQELEAEAAFVARCEDQIVDDEEIRLD